MSSSSTVYMNVSKNLEIPIIIDKVKRILNGIVDDTYLKENVPEKEINPKMPLLRNASRIRYFLYEPIVYGNDTHQSFRARFNLFVSPDLVGGFTSTLKLKDGVVVPNQSRTISILTNNNGDADSVGIKLKDNSEYLTISMGSDIVGQKTIERLSDELYSLFKAEIYIKHEFSELIEIS